MSSWGELEAVLDEAAQRGDMIRVWWRDDDAGHSHPALDRLLDLAERHGLPIALAVVPMWLGADVQGRIAASGQATVLQHGYRHADHAAAGDKPIEVGGRTAAHCLAELREGQARLEDAFGAAFLAMLVPPWNRIDERVIEHLTEAGFRGLSTFGPREGIEAAPGLPLINTHLDPVDWRGSRLFVGEEAALGRLAEMLALDEPVGILTHHLVMDEAGWRFLDQLLDLLAHHPAARFCAPGQLLEHPA